MVRWHGSLRRYGLVHQTRRAVSLRDKADFAWDWWAKTGDEDALRGALDAYCEALWIDPVRGPRSEARLRRRSAQWRAVRVHYRRGFGPGSGCSGRR